LHDALVPLSAACERRKNLPPPRVAQRGRPRGAAKGACPLRIPCLSFLSYLVVSFRRSCLRFCVFSPLVFLLPVSACLLSVSCLPSLVFCSLVRFPCLLSAVSPFRFSCPLSSCLPSCLPFCLFGVWSSLSIFPCFSSPFSCLCLFVPLSWWSFLPASVRRCNQFSPR
jgi:hypothetical protein